MLPLGLIVALISLVMKFDQPFFDRIDSFPEIGQSLPTKKNWQYAIWHLSLRLLETVFAGAFTAVFLAGAYLPIPAFDGFEVLSSSLNFVVKCAIVLMVITLIRTLLPRMRLDQLLNFCWKILVPLALVSIILIGGVRSYFSLY